MFHLPELSHCSRRAGKANQYPLSSWRLLMAWLVTSCVPWVPYQGVLSPVLVSHGYHFRQFLGVSKHGGITSIPTTPPSLWNYHFTNWYIHFQLYILKCLPNSLTKFCIFPQPSATRVTSSTTVTTTPLSLTTMSCSSFKYDHFITSFRYYNFFEDWLSAFKFHTHSQPFVSFSQYPPTLSSSAYRHT